MKHLAPLLVAALTVLSSVWSCGPTPATPDAGVGGGSATAGGSVAGGAATAGGSAMAGGAASAGGSSAGGPAGGLASAGGAALAGGAASAGGDAGGSAVAGGASSAGGAAMAGGVAAAGGTSAAGGVATAGGTAGGSASAGGAAGGASSNMPPFVNSITVTAAGSSTAITGPVFAGRNLSLTVDAFDPENDPLTITWTALDGGTLTNPMAVTASWFSPQVATVGSPYPEFPVRVSVTDGNSAPVSLEATIQVRAPFLSELMQFDGVLGRTTPGGCSSSTCHGGTPSAANPAASAMQLQPFNLTATRTALTGNTAKVGCTPTARVSPGSPTFSLLIKKVDRSEVLSVSCGARMPYMLAALPANELVTLRSWVAAGAP